MLKHFPHGSLIVLLLATTTNAHSENLQWFSNQYDNVTYLGFGIPDSDYTTIGFHCAIGDETVRVLVPHDAPDAVDGQPMTVTLSSSTGSVEINATGHFEEIDDLFHLEGLTRLDGNLARMLSSGDALRVSVDGTAQDFPLAGISNYVDELVATCGAAFNPDDLEIKIANETGTTIVSVLFSEGGRNDFDGDTYGNHLLLPNESTYLVIPAGKSVCDFDLIAEFDEEAERDPIIKSQNLCDEAVFVVAGP